MPKIAIKKSNNSFVPVYNSDLTATQKIKDNVIYWVEIKKARNIKHHKKLFAIAKLIIANLPETNIWHNKTAHSLIKATEIELGYVKQKIKLSGEPYFEPESINFESWDEDKFSEFYDKAILLWAEKFEYELEDLENNFSEYM